MSVGQRPRVSIGLPVYNGARYLARALDSILGQTYSDYEVIIADNASTDATRRICESYASTDQRIRYFRNPRNLGAAPNFNRVFELATGEYFKWAAYDDELEPDFLNSCVRELDTHPEAVLCYTRVRIIDEHSQVTEEYIPEPQTVGIQPHKRFRNLILYPHLATQLYGLLRSAVLVRTSLLGSFPSSDEVLLAQLGLMGEFLEVPEPSFRLRVHPEQSTRGALAAQRDRIVWFNTSLVGKVVLPKWQYLIACVRVVMTSSLGTRQKIYCCTQLAHWVLDPPHFRALGKDILIACRRLAQSSVKSPYDALRSHHVGGE